MGVYPVSWILARRLCLVVVVACSVCFVCFVFVHIPWLCVCGVVNVGAYGVRACVCGVRVGGFALFYVFTLVCLSYLSFVSSCSVLSVKKKEKCASLVGVYRYSGALSARRSCVG